MTRRKEESNILPVFPFLIQSNSETERDAALRVIANQPDSALLGAILGLIEPTEDKPEATPKPRVIPRTAFKAKLWCDEHNMARQYKNGESGETVCLQCRKDKSLRRYYAKINKPMPETVRHYVRKGEEGVA